MQKIKYVLVGGLILIIFFLITQIDEYKRIVNSLSNQDTKHLESIKDLSLQKEQIKKQNQQLIKEIKILKKEKILTIDIQESRFNKLKSNKDIDILYKNLESSKFDNSKYEHKDDIKITPTVIFDKDKDNIGLKLQMQTTF